MQTARERPRVLGFDGLRAIAASLVVLNHAGAMQSFKETPLYVMLQGEAAVHLFFILSGFLITRLLLLEHEDEGSIDIRGFYIRRAFRILPLYVLFLIITAVQRVFLPYVTNDQSLLFAALYIYNFIPRAWYMGQLGHLWSLGVEEHFYLLWPWVFQVLFPRGRALMIASAIALVGCTLCRFLLEGTSLSSDYFIDRWTITAGGSIMLGCLCALLAALSPRVAATLGSRWALLAAVVLWGNAFLPLGSVPLMKLLRTIGFAGIVCWIYYNQSSGIARVLESAPLRFIGMISYGIYMYQGLFLWTGPNPDPTHVWPPPTAIGVVLVAVCSVVSYFAIEKRMIALGRKLTTSSPSAGSLRSSGRRPRG